MKAVTDFKSLPKAKKGGANTLIGVGFGVLLSVIASARKFFEKDKLLEQKYEYKQKIQNLE